MYKNRPFQCYYMLLKISLNIFMIFPRQPFSFFNCDGQSRGSGVIKILFWERGVDIFHYCPMGGYAPTPPFTLINNLAVQKKKLWRNY